MRKREFERLVEALPGLSAAQLRVLVQRVGALSGRREVQDVTDKRIEALAACPHCAHATFARWGRTKSGDQRYRCASCKKTFLASPARPSAVCTTSPSCWRTPPAWASSSVCARPRTAWASTATPRSATGTS